MAIKTNEWGEYVDSLNDLVDSLNDLVLYYKNKFRCPICGGQSEYMKEDSLRCLNCGYIFKF